MFITIKEGARNRLIARIKQKLQELRQLPIVEQRTILAKPEFGSTLLHAAIERDVSGVLQTLLEAFNQATVSLDLKDDAGNTPLHAAVIKVSLESINALINNGASLSVTNGAELTPYQLASLISAAEPHNPVYKKIVATLHLREKYQHILGNIKLSKLINLLKESQQQIEVAKDSSKLLFIGGTGVCKSTLLNYLYGARYRLGVNIAGKEYAECIDGIEIAEPGRRASSQTLHPLVLQKAGLNYVYCDLAGLEDTRPFEEKICAASGVQMLACLPGSIQGIVVVLDLPGFQSLKGDSFKRTAIALANMLNFCEELLDSVHFVITKIPAGSKIQPQNIIDEYIEQILESVDAELGEQATMEDKALVFMLQQMQKRPQQIYIPDIADHGECARDLQQLFMRLPRQKPQLFNFLNHDVSQKVFIAKLVEIAKDYLSSKAKIEQHYPAMIRASYQDLIEQNRKVSQYHVEMQTKSIDLGKKQHAEKSITRRISKLGNNTLDILKYERELGEVKVTINRLQSELEELRTITTAAIKQQKSLGVQLDDLRSEAATINLEFNVNKEFFSMIYDLIQISGFSTIEALSGFCKEFAHAEGLDREDRIVVRRASVLPMYSASLTSEIDPLTTAHRTSRIVSETVVKLAESEHKYERDKMRHTS